ncbi:MAG: tetratricopeptide repeat protein, partial [Pyrinomonadaceae bacterium]
MTYAQMEKDLSKYVAQNSYKYSLVTLKNKMEFDSEIQVSPLSDGAANAYLGDLLYHTNRADDAEEYLQKALVLEPNSSMANTTLGMVKLRQRKYPEAKTYLEKAITEDQKNHLAFYRYAYLLSREDRDDYGYVNSFPAEKLSKMRELLKKAIAINPAFTESYELLAFINIVNNEQLDESVQLLQNALKYQPGNQRYAMRIAEIYMRQDKFTEAEAIAAKIAQTADEPDVKTQAENLSNQIRQRQEFSKKQEEYRRNYGNSAVNSSDGSGAGQTVILRRSQSQSSISPEEIAKIEAAAKLRSVNLALRKPEASENRALGRIQNIDCKNKSVTYTVKTADENFKLSSKDFESLNVITFVPESQNISIGCGAKIEDILMILTFKSQPDARSGIRGELVAVEFVPNSFRLMTESEMAEDPYDKMTDLADNSVSEASQTSTAAASESNLNYIKNSLRQPQAGEKREMGFIEKMECSPKGNFFYIKTANENLVLSVNVMQPLQIKGFTPEIQQVKFACGMKRVDIPVVVSYREGGGSKTGVTGEIISLEFVPKNFKLD